MPDLALLTPDAVEIPSRELFEATIHDDASALGEEVRCIVDPLLATDPMSWTPITVAQIGTWYPKNGDRAILGFPEGGPPVILQWWPLATEPDVSF